MDPPPKHKTSKFNEYKLFNKQNDRLAEVIDRIITRPQDRQSHYNGHNKPYNDRDRGIDHRNCLSYDRGYDRGRGNFRQMSHNRNRRNSSFRGKSGGYNNSKESYWRPDYYRDGGDSKQARLSGQSRSPTRRLRVASRSPSREIDGCFSCRQFSHFSKDCPEKVTSVGKVQHKEEKSPSTQDVPICMMENKKKMRK